MYTLLPGTSHCMFSGWGKLWILKKVWKKKITCLAVFDCSSTASYILYILNQTFQTCNNINTMLLVSIGGSLLECILKKLMIA